MGSNKAAIIVMLIFALVLGAGGAWGQQVWTKCHITCRCLQDNSVANFSFMIPVDRSPDIGFEADLACKSYGERICPDGCNSLKFAYTYQVTSP